MGDETRQSGRPLWQVEWWNPWEWTENNYFFSTHRKRNNLLCWDTLCYARTQEAIMLAIEGKNLQCGWQGSGSGCSERLWNPHLWAKPQATCSDFEVSPALRWEFCCVTSRGHAQIKLCFESAILYC